MAHFTRKLDEANLWGVGVWGHTLQFELGDAPIKKTGNCGNVLIHKISCPEKILLGPMGSHVRLLWLRWPSPNVLQGAPKGCPIAY